WVLTMTYKWLQALNLLSHAWLVRFCCCALLALPWACNGYGQTASSAVVAGIGSYQSTELKSLQYAANDANDFAAFLASPQGQNLAPDNIVLLLDAQATLANIRSALGDHVAKRAKPGDKVFFYFAGHAGNEVDFLASGQADTAKYLLAFDS